MPAIGPGACRRFRNLVPDKRQEARARRRASTSTALCRGPRQSAPPPAPGETNARRRTMHPADHRRQAAVGVLLRPSALLRPAGDKRQWVSHSNAPIATPSHSDASIATPPLRTSDIGCPLATPHDNGCPLRPSATRATVGVPLRPPSATRATVGVPFATSPCDLRPCDPRPLATRGGCPLATRRGSVAAATVAGPASR